MIASALEFAARVQGDVALDTADLLLEIAEDLIVAEIGTPAEISARLELDPVWTSYPARIKGIQLDMATRAYVNPSGVQHETFETYSRTGIPRGGVYMTKEERDVLRSAAGLHGIVSIALATNEDLIAVPYWSSDWP
jgi:hypothetical protein